MSDGEKLRPFTPAMDRDVEISADGDVVTIAIHCAGVYEAQVLKEDFSERLRAGRHIVIAMAIVAGGSDAP